MFMVSVPYGALGVTKLSGEPRRHSFRGPSARVTLPVEDWLDVTNRRYTRAVKTLAGVQPIFNHMLFF